MMPSHDLDICVFHLRLRIREISPEVSSLKSRSFAQFDRGERNGERGEVAPCRDPSGEASPTRR